MSVLVRGARGPDGAPIPCPDLPEGARVIDAAGKIAVRSFVIAHHHVYSALARGMPPPPRRPASFAEMLELVWWRLDRVLDHDMIRACALATAVEAARCGCTFVIDHHSSPHAAEGSLHVIADAFDEVGVGHLLCYELSDRDGPECLAAGLRETEAYLRARPGLVGLHASFTVSDALLERAVDLARAQQTGIHVHVAEARSDQEHCLATHGKPVVARLAAAGALRPRTLLAHCLHLDDAERALLAAAPAWIVQNEESNQHNCVGRFDARGLPAGRILIGTDGMHSDPLQSARAAFLAAPAAGPAPFWQRLGQGWDYLDAAGLADPEDHLVLLDYDPPTPLGEERWPAHALYGLTRAHVDTVIAGGRVLVEGGRVTTVDEARVMAQAREQAARLWQRLG